MFLPPDPEPRDSPVKEPRAYLDVPLLHLRLVAGDSVGLRARTSPPRVRSPIFRDLSVWMDRHYRLRVFVVRCSSQYNANCRVINTHPPTTAPVRIRITEGQHYPTEPLLGLQLGGVLVPRRGHMPKPASASHKIHHPPPHRLCSTVAGKGTLASPVHGPQPAT